jgi:replicative DNA helicase
VALAEVSPRRTDGRVPPHNLDAEESLLGAMLLSRDAIVAATEVGLTPDEFYKPAHGHVYDAVTSLYGAGEPADPVTVAEELRRAGLLDAIGGPSLLVTLQASTPATSNAARYARIISEHALLRRLIGVAGEIAELGYGMPEDVIGAVDRAESMVFDVAQRRVTDSMSPIKDLLDASLTRLEMLYDKGDTITGLPTGYHGLDELMSGLQPSTLVVIGARPAMGKTSFALGMAAHAALEANRPVLFFSLEMSHLEITQRILSAEARVDSSRMRNGKLAEADWTKISHAIGRLAEAPLYIDDNPQTTVMEIRAKSRRLKSRIGDLGLVVIDYLQLMTGRTSAENRQVEVSEISRGLKILARELETPVVALSQLSRGLEMRADKRPMLADLRESGCLVAETRIQRADTGATVTLGELLATGARDVPVWTLDHDWRLVEGVLTHAFPSGVKPTFRLRLASGREVVATDNHPFRRLDGWAALGDLRVGDLVAVPRRLPAPDRLEAMATHEVVLLAHLLGDGCVLPGQPVRYTSADPENLDAVEEAAGHFGIVPRRTAGGACWQTDLPAPGGTATSEAGGPPDASGSGSGAEPVGGDDRYRRNPVAAWWDELGLRGCRSHQRFVPDRVHAMPDAQVRLFLRHLWATHGSVTVAPGAGRQAVRIHYATTSRRLADGVRDLLLRCGIQSRTCSVLTGEHGLGFSVEVSGVVDQRRFLEDVGVHGARSTAVEAALAVLADVVPNPNVDAIPAEVRGQVVDAMADAGLTPWGLAEAIGEPDCGRDLLGSDAGPRTMTRPRLASFAQATGSTSLADLAGSDVHWDHVVAIEPLGEAPVYDATVLGTHNFLADGVVVHNSIEQDADVVMFIYRDEVYNSESPDRGTAEVLVAKHRSGPTGMDRLAFLDHYTRFANMARGM